jgi:hypothetical protein
LYICITYKNVVYKFLQKKSMILDTSFTDFILWSCDYILWSCDYLLGYQWCCEFESRSGRGVQHYVIKFVSDLQQVNGFLWVLRFPPPIKLIVKHHKIMYVLLLLLVLYSFIILVVCSNYININLSLFVSWCFICLPRV